MTEHFENWAVNYDTYISPWYGKICLWFMERGFEPPGKKNFYFYCYQNSRSYYDIDKKIKLPPIVSVPERF